MFITATWIGQRERINEFEGKTVEITHTKQQRLFPLGVSTFKKMHRILRNLWDYNRCNVCVAEVPEEEEKESEAEKIFEEIMAVMSQSGKTHKPIDS